MEEIKTVNYKGKDIISIDYSKCGNDQQKVIAIASEAAAIMAKMPLNSALVLINVKNFTFSSEIIQKFKENLVTTKDRRKKQAIIGVDDGLRNFLYHTITRFAHINIPSFNSETEAMEWLVSEE